MTTTTLTFLAADRPLTKKFSKINDVLTKEPYPKVWEFTSQAVVVDSLETFRHALETKARDGWCLLKGNVQRDLVKESRAGSTDPNAPTSWLVFDVDRFPGVIDPQDFMDLIGLHAYSYIVQYSASYKIEAERGLTCHIYVRLAEPTAPALLKAYFLDLNLNTPSLTKHIRLTRTGNGLSYPLDVTTGQNDKLIYISPPMLEGIESPVTERIQLVRREKEFFSLPDVSPDAVLRSQIDERINALREAQGLPARRFSYRIDKKSGVEVLAKPDGARLTGVKQERGFVYFNLNGGDSWGYYHPEDRPEVIYNFKGEPNYLTSELLPDYWSQVVEQRAKDKAALEEDIKSRGFVDSRILVFRDFRTGLYYNGTFDADTDKLSLAIAKSETQIQHFLQDHGLPEIDWIPIWDVIYDPQSDVRVDFQRRRVNLFEPSIYMKREYEPVESFESACPTINKLIESAVGTGPVKAHYLNWAAVVWQYRIATGMSWVLHGVQGTGKGILANYVWAPLFGRSNVSIKRMEELEDQFNEHLERSLLVFIDEAEIGESRQSKMIMANLKNNITEPTITIRRMRAAAYTVRNYCNFQLYSNMTTPVVIDSTDRRFSVGSFGQTRLELTDEEFEQIGEELPALAAYLTHHAANRDQARTVFQSSERDRIIATSRTSVELVAEALTKGMLEAFWEELPNGDTTLLPPHQAMLAESYVDLVHRMIRGEANRLARDELRLLFQYLCGDMPTTPTKFTQLLRHKNIHLKNMLINGRVMRGLEVTWNVDQEWLEARRAEISPKLKFKEKVA